MNYKFYNSYFNTHHHANQYVVLDIERYKELRANELDLAYLKSLQDIEKGNFKVQSAQEHIDELRNEL